ncbi:MAG: hypothetical protein ACI3Y9_07750 [Candidatus Cryptobacteroides sp.]
MDGLFSVAKNAKVIFSPGNVRYDNGSFGFAKPQTAVCAADNASIFPRADLFQLADGREVLTYAGEDVSESFHRWKDSLEHEWFVPSVSQWKYLISERPASTISGVKNARFVKCTVRGTACLMLFPDDFTFPDGVNLPPRPRINDKTGDFSKVEYDYVAMRALEKAGCILLPAINWDWEPEEFSINRIQHGYDLENGERLTSGNYWALSDKEADGKYHHFIFSSKHYQIGSFRLGLEYAAFIRLVAFK